MNVRMEICQPVASRNTDEAIVTGGLFPEPLPSVVED
jgi:hypothetical protein